MRVKRRDVEFLLVPLSFLVLIATVVIALVGIFRSFERSYMREARESLVLQADFVSRVLLPDLCQNNIVAVAHSIDVFREKPFRITVIAKDGRVVADSDADVAQMENHANRPEIREELGTDQSIERYSETMNCRLLYYSVRSKEGWIIRVSMPMDVIGGVMKQMRWMAAIAILMGAFLAAAVALYLFLRVAPHFNKLQTFAVAIAKGNLDAVIQEPKSALLRELAGALTSMTQQLKNRISELDRERNEFDSLFNALREPLLLISYEGAVLSSNRAAAKLLGDELRSDTFRITQFASPELVAYVQSAFSEEELHSREIPFNDRGIQRFLLARAVRLERNGEMCLLLLLTDLTDLRRLEGFRSDFVANVSHEIKTPLTAIVSTVETLSEMPLDDAARKKCYDILSRQARRLNALVMDILSLAAIERRQSARKRDFTTVRLDAVVRETLQLCQDEVERAGMELRAVGTPFPEVNMRGDAQLLEQALINLITNAVRYSGAAVIDVKLTLLDAVAEITVKDYGCGIAAEHLPRLFERFYRVQKDRSRECGGTGLGLAIVKHIVLLHRGRVRVESTPGEGTTFTLQLPLDK